jgi:hypothetical protein
VENRETDGHGFAFTLEHLFGERGRNRSFNLLIKSRCNGCYQLGSPILISAQDVVENSLPFCDLLKGVHQISLGQLNVPVKVL